LGDCGSAFLGEKSPREIKRKKGKGAAWARRSGSAGLANCPEKPEVEALWSKSAKQF